MLVVVSSQPTHPDPAPLGADPLGRERTGGGVTTGDAGAVAAGLLRIEAVIVVAIAVGASSSRSVLRFLAAVTAPEPLSSQTATLNSSQAPGRPWIDLGLQLVFVCSLMLPVALALYLVARSGDRWSSIGLRVDRLPRDTLIGVGAAAAVGGVGLAGYLIAREAGASLTLVPTSLPDVWWRIPVLILSACANSALEEVVLVGYLGSRVRKLGGSVPLAIGISAVVRAFYHLYQGLSGFLGNLVMGAIFATYFQRSGRIVPLIIAHALIDVVAFVGYLLVSPHVSWL
jgi:membrane protease YdiL (CAAX protease family)